MFAVTFNEVIETLGSKRPIESLSSVSIWDAVISSIFSNNESLLYENQRLD